MRLFTAILAVLFGLGALKAAWTAWDAVYTTICLAAQRDGEWKIALLALAMCVFWCIIAGAAAVGCLFWGGWLAIS